jgi:hypothetical protein
VTVLAERVVRERSSGFRFTSTLPSGPTWSFKPVPLMSLLSAQARFVGWRSRYSADRFNEPWPTGKPQPPFTLTLPPSYG